MPVQKLKDFLDAEGVKYVLISHSPAYTAQEIAASAAVSGNELAKTVMIKVDGKMAMAVLRAPDHVDFDRLSKGLGTYEITLAEEDVFKELFPNCETGAMPPFGNLYGMNVYVDKRLTNDEEIAFNAGTLTELVKLSYADFARLAEPEVLEFAV